MNKDKIEQCVEKHRKKCQKKQQIENTLKKQLLVNYQNNQNNGQYEYKLDAHWLVGICGLYFFQPNVTQ